MKTAIMDEGNEQSVDQEFHLDVESNNESQKERNEKKVQSHEVFCNDYDSGKENIGFLVNRKSDLDALESVYGYARKIKSFLGWEPYKDDSDWTKSFDGSVCENSNVKKGQDGEFSELVNESNNLKVFIAGVTDDQIANSNLSDSSIEYDDSEITSTLGFKEYNSNLYNEEKQNDGKAIKLQIPETNACFVNILEEDIENNFQEEIFRSEVNIYVDGGEDYTGIVVPSLEKELLEDSSIRLKLFENRKMNEPLYNDEKSEAGLALNNADGILGEERQVESSLNIKIDTSYNSNTPLSQKLDVKSENSIFESHGIFGSDKPSENIYQEQIKSECQNILDRIYSLVDESKPNIEHVRNPSSDVVKNIIISDQSSVQAILNQKNEQKNNKKLDYNSVDQKNDAKNLENDTYVVENATDKCQNHKIPNTNNTIKAYIAYTNGDNKPSILETTTCMEKQPIEFKDNVFDDEDIICGFGRFRPRWLQPWATVKVYAILYSILCILHGSYYSYLVGTLSTLEKRFAFKSKISGTIMMADEVTPLLIGIFIGYYVRKGHRPRIAAIGMLLSAGCCFVTALPYFIYGSVQHLTHLNAENKTESEFCDSNIQNESCDADERPPTLPAVLFLLLGSFLKGFGTLAYYAIGLAYMDDNSEKKSTPIYLAIALALRLLGPILGFLMSSISLKYYENPFVDPGFGPDDPRWIGAWWVGFLVQGVLLTICTLPIALFPRRLPSHKKPEQKASSAKDENWKNIFSGLVDALKRLGKNPIFLCMSVNTVLKLFGHFGHSIMLPKYMENQFKLSASDASLYSGATSLCCIMVSTVLGGFLIWKFRPSAKMLLIGMLASEICMCLGFLILMIPKCQMIDMSNFGQNDQGLILNGECNLNCDCSTSAFTPFCDQDGKTMYFSPCYAGCTQQLTTSSSKEEKKTFGNCSCVAEELALKAGTITEGFCVDENCWTQTVAYLCVLLILLSISSTLTVAHTIILLRSVHPRDKSFALGTFETFCCLFGFVPIPITYGAIVDSACLVWGQSCGQTGNCWFYDMSKYRYLLHGCSTFFCALSVCCIITLYCFRDRIRNLYEEEADGDEEPVAIKLDTVSGSVTKL